jgi:succinate dehydrogenase/fumarate reductase flavoprotein subunit
LDARGSNRVDSDVLVVGGGAAGVAAAVTAARRGLKVTLVERYGFCGGGAVAGLSGTVCGLYEATEAINAKPKQVVFGFERLGRGSTTPWFGARKQTRCCGKPEYASCSMLSLAT